MKVADKLIFLFKDPDGFGAAIYGALRPSPNSSIRRSEESFELPLDRYEIKGAKACGEIAHFIDNDGVFSSCCSGVGRKSSQRSQAAELLLVFKTYYLKQTNLLEVSVLLLEYCEPPFLACAVNEVLGSIAGEQAATSRTIVFPFVVSESKLKSEDKTSSRFDKGSIYGMQFGAEASFTSSVVSKAQKLPPVLQVHYEPLACLLQFVRVLKTPTALLVGLGDVYQSRDNSKDDLEVVYGIGELLASSSSPSISFVRDGITLNARKQKKVAEAPWRSLYG